MKNLLNKLWIWLGGEAQPSASESPLSLSKSGDDEAPPPASKPAAVPPPARKLAGRRIVVKAGDTLSALALRHNVPVQGIVKLNYLPDEQANLQAGQTLFLPPSPSPKQEAKPSAGQPVAYRVRGDDTLENIARKFGLTIESISVENKITDPAKLLPGQWLVIPAAQAGQKPPEVAALPEKPSLTEPAPQTKSAPPAKPKGGPIPLPLPKSKSLLPQPPVQQAPPAAKAKPAQPKQQIVPSPKKEPQTLPPQKQAPPIVQPAAKKPKVLPPVEKVEPKLPLPPTDDFDIEFPPEDDFEPDIPVENITAGRRPPAAAFEEKTDEAAQIVKKPELLEPLIIPPGATQGIYLAYHVLANQAEYPQIVKLIETTNINCVVVDFKNDWSYLSLPVSVPLAKHIGATRLTLHSLPSLLNVLKKRNIYLVARVVTFKDNLLAKTYPELAAKYPQQAEIWRDAQGYAWTDPFQQDVWAYNMDLAVEAAQTGFDEIQFDFARFPAPDANGAPQFSQPLNPQNRMRAVSGFLSASYGALSALRVKVSATIAGYACWRWDDNLTGQNVESMAPYLDVLTPLLYPSTLTRGIVGCRQALACPYEVAYQGTKNLSAKLRAMLLQRRVRPWLQDFEAWQFKGKRYGASGIQAQMRGAFDAGASGYAAWNTQCVYTEEAYRKS